ncbi:NAD(P)H-hydrate dehydratase [Enterococcus sp. BWR-S5]|uniref:NAD(P)H-hydrate dehydratase n=1 Tax=Enterococcus sp. BWR-S5 TaxID=2787714 RepID=UPI001920A051|nr:NAD(P)H-hydrate dehydratase [Enterococcus sp. BWR-S5]
MQNLSNELLSQVIRKRPEKSHKGTFGKVVLVGGNAQYGGAIIMSAQAAVQAGAGLVTVVTDKANHSPLHARLPEAMVVDWENQPLIDEVLKNADVVLIGPGMGIEQQNERMLQFLLKKQTENQWLIIDGSAITLFAKHPHTLNYPDQTIFTPHQMEWERLSGLPIEEQTTENNQQSQRHLEAVVIVKSHRTEIYTPQETYKNPLGTAAMATGGMGDTLAGILTAFLAQFDNKEQAIGAAVYLHSLIGETLGEKRYVVLPTELANQLPYYMKHFER